MRTSSLSPWLVGWFLCLPLLFAQDPKPKDEAPKPAEVKPVETVAHWKNLLQLNDDEVNGIVKLSSAWEVHEARRNRPVLFPGDRDLKRFERTRPALKAESKAHEDGLAERAKVRVLATFYVNLRETARLQARLHFGLFGPIANAPLDEDLFSVRTLSLKRLEPRQGIFTHEYVCLVTRPSFEEDPGLPPAAYNLLVKVQWKSGWNGVILTGQFAEPSRKGETFSFRAEKLASLVADQKSFRSSVASRQAVLDLKKLTSAQGKAEVIKAYKARLVGKKNSRPYLESVLQLRENRPQAPTQYFLTYVTPYDETIELEKRDMDIEVFEFSPFREPQEFSPDLL